MNKIRTLLQNKFFVGTMCFVLLLFLIGQVKNFSERYAVEKEIKALNAQADKLQRENQELQSFVAYLRTDNYKEKAAREQLNMKKEGEQVFSFAQQKTEEENLRAEEAELETKEKGNVGKWWSYFFNNQEE